MGSQLCVLVDGTGCSGCDGTSVGGQLWWPGLPCSPTIGGTGSGSVSPIVLDWPESCRQSGELGYGSGPSHTCPLMLRTLTCRSHGGVPGQGLGRRVLLDFYRRAGCRTTHGAQGWPVWMLSAGVPALGDFPGGGIEGHAYPACPFRGWGHLRS